MQTLPRERNRTEARRAHTSEEMVRLLHQEVELSGGEFREILSFERLADRGRLNCEEKTEQEQVRLGLCSGAQN